MIDLTKKELTTAVLVSGQHFPIFTDFRVWVKFSIDLKNWDKKSDLNFSYVFKNDIPLIQTENDIKSIFDFFSNPNKLPNNQSSSDINVLDYEIDSEYIYCAFKQQYNIDLIDIENLHWHKFKALLGGITEPTMLSSIMGYRCYSGTDKEYQKLRSAWELPKIYTAEEKLKKEEFDKIFN